MRLWEDGMPLTKEPHPLPQVPLPWLVPSLVLPSLESCWSLCRRLAQNGEWAFPIVTGPLFVLTFSSLVFLNFSDAGILHQELDHHCRCVNNCIRQCNLGFFMLLVLSLCLYSVAMLVTSVVFLLRTTHRPFCMDKVIAYPPGYGPIWGAVGRAGAVEGQGPGGGAN
ncbi:hypothetical protein HPG69_010507, partial [Diceros bicornis minor]